MSYSNAKDILPEELLEMIQMYIEGDCIYIPKRETSKKPWGTETTTRLELAQRNKAIFEDYQKDMTTTELANKYHLSLKSIQRIVKEQKIYF